MKKLSYLFLLAFLLSAADAFAANKYWYGATNTDFNTASNWSTSNTGYVAAAAIPGSSDVANYGSYTGMTNANCSLSANINVAGLTIVTGYTGTITQGTYNITIGTTGATLSAGTFTGGSGNITASGAFTISGCAFTSTSGTFSSSANFTYSSGSFSNNNGKMKFTATCTITGSISLYQLEFAPAAASTYTIASGTTLTVNNTLTISGTVNAILSTGTIDAKGDITVTNTGTAASSSALLKITGTAKQTLTGASSGTTAMGKLPPVLINKSDTLKLVNTICFSGDWTYVAGVIDAGSSTLFMVVSGTVTGSHAINNLLITGSISLTIASGTTLTVMGNFTINGTTVFSINGPGIIDLKGDLVVNNTSANASGNGTITMTSTGSQTITGSGTAFGGVLPSVTINKSSGTLSMSGVITVGGTWTYTAGTLSTGTSTLCLSSGVITGSQTLNNLYLAGGNTVSAGTTLDVSGTLRLSTSSTFSLAGTIHAKGNVVLAGTYTNTTVSTGSIIIDGTGNQLLSSSVAIGLCGMPHTEINKSSGTLSLSGLITVNGNWTYTAGTVSAGTSTVIFRNTKTISGSHTLKNVVFTGSSAATITIASGTVLTIDSTMTDSSSFGVTFNTGTIYAKGDLNFLHTITSGSGGTATLLINGTVNQTFTGSSTSSAGRIGNVEINKSSGTLTLTNDISVYGNWKYTAGTVNATSSSNVNFIIGNTITGSHALYNVSFNHGQTYTIATGTTLTVNGTLSWGGTLGVTFTGGRIDCHGDVTTSNTATTGGGSTILALNGTGTQTLTSTGAIGQGRYPKIFIDKTSGTLNLSGMITVTAGLAYNHGTVNAGTSTVAFYGTQNLDGQESGASNTMPFYDVTIGSGTVTLIGNLDVNHDLTISSGSTLSAGNNSIFVGRDWNSQGTWTYATSTVTFDGAGYQHITAASAPVNFYAFGSNKTGGSLSLLKAVKVNNSMTLTQGHIITTGTNYLELIDNATLTGGGDGGYVDGPMIKTGDDGFTFPLGDTTLNDTAYHPLSMSTPSATGDQFLAEYAATGQTLGDSLADTLTSIEDCEYWTFKRNSGTSSVNVSVGWNKNSCSIDNYDDLRVATWDGAKWIDMGASSTTIGSVYSGVVLSSVSFTFPITPIHYIVIAKKNITKPYAELLRKLDGGYYYVSNGSLQFHYNEEYQDNQLGFNIYNDKHQLVTSNTLIGTALLPSIVTSYGDNRYTINTANCNISPAGYLPSGYYILEVINEKNEKWYLRFKNTNNLIYTNCGPNNGSN